MELLEVRMRATELRNALAAAATTPEEQSYCETLTRSPPTAIVTRNSCEREIARRSAS